MEFERILFLLFTSVEVVAFISSYAESVSYNYCILLATTVLTIK